MLDAARARAEADAAERRGAGTLWAQGPVSWEKVSVGAVDQPEVVPVVEGASTSTRGGAVPVSRPARLDGAGGAPTALLSAILARLETMTMTPATGVPSWLVEAVGDPRAYDAAAAHRKDVCARVDPALYRRLQAMRERLGLRTMAGAWEYVLRAGLAVGERGA